MVEWGIEFESFVFDCLEVVKVFCFEEIFFENY